jgi:hypothetical protein
MIARRGLSRRESTPPDCVTAWSVIERACPGLIEDADAQRVFDGGQVGFTSASERCSTPGLEINQHLQAA